MARLAKLSESPAPRFSEDLYNASPEPTNERDMSVTVGNPSLSPSPVASNSSDKENLSQRATIDKGKGRAAMPPPRLPPSLSGRDRAGKRKRVEEQHVNNAQGHQRRRTVESQDVDSDDSDVYDPDQDPEERRRLRKGLRDLSKDLNDNRAEYLSPASTGLIKTLEKADEITSSIKQTTDATIDSRLLVNTADLSYRKTVQITLGSAAQGVDVDEFVSKCISLMRRSNGLVQDGPRIPSSTQQRQRRQNAGTGSDAEDGEDGDMLSWDSFGRLACLRHNSRPATPGFLLGPLSLEKRARKPVQRRVGLRNNNLAETRPEVLQPSDIEKSENGNLTVLCTRILSTLKKVQSQGMEAVDSEASDAMTEEETRLLMEKYGIHQNGGVDLFKFVVNPHSFGQTVENLFYVSFLIRDGKAGISIDDDGLPTLEPTEPRKRTEAIGKGMAKHQAILSIDMATWRKLIHVFNIVEPMIPHRIENEQTQVGTRGWYS